MHRMYLLLSCLMIFSVSCEKKVSQPALAGKWEWTVQYTNNPAYNSTPQNTGVQETILFNPDNSYSLVRNNTTVTTGTYRTSSTKSRSGYDVASVLFTNNRVADSVAYYELHNSNDSLFFSNDFIGTTGSGSRHYGRK